jgi:chloramphenicol 3-O-phosphotransferase
MNAAKIYLLEGADGTGKSSAIVRARADIIRAYLPAPRIIHNTAEDAHLPGSLFLHYRAQLLDAANFARQGVSTFIDRGAASELIYGRVYRRRARITARQVDKLERLAVKLDVKLVGFKASALARAQRLNERGEVYTGVDVIVADQYIKHFHRPNSAWNTVDSTSAFITL